MPTRRLPVASAATLGALAVLHGVWAFSPWPLRSRARYAEVVVGVDERDLPSTTATLGVATLLAVAARLVLRRSGVRVLSAVLVMRGAAGLGVSGSGWGDAPKVFRRLDLAVYSPLCLALGAAVHPATPSVAARCSRRVGLALTRVTDDRVLRAARKTMSRKTYCVLVTDGPDGPGARVVQPHAPDDDLTVHLGTAAGSRKASDVARTGSAVLVYEDDARAACVVLHCDAEVVDLGPAGRERWFMTAWLAFWPRGSIDEDFVVVRCRPHTIEVWDALRGITPAPYGLASARMVRTPSGWAAAGEPAQRPEPASASA